MLMSPLLRQEEKWLWKGESRGKVAMVQQKKNLPPDCRFLCHKIKMVKLQLSIPPSGFGRSIQCLQVILLTTFIKLWTEWSRRSWGQAVKKIFFYNFFTYILTFLIVTYHTGKIQKILIIRISMGMISWNIQTLQKTIVVNRSWQDYWGIN